MCVIFYIILRILWESTQPNPMKNASDRATQNLDLLKQYHRTGHPRLKQKLSELNQGLVRKEAKRWQGQCSEPFEDLFQEGCIGLLKAIDRFDPTLGNAFSSFAIPKINGAIMHYLRDRGWGLMRPPRRVGEEYARVQRSHREMLKAGRAETLDQVAMGLGIAEEKWREMKRMRTRKPLISLDEGDRPYEVVDEANFEATEQDDWKSWIFAELETLPEFQRIVICESVLAEQKVEAIAKRHRCSVALVEIAINQGLQRLRSGHLEV
jgi:RNA polymerase sigma-B factor